ncbi:DUF4097 family beta strand repeat-containing protein [Streptomyces daliensis]
MNRRLRILTAFAAVGIGAGALSACALGPASTAEDDASVTEKITSVRLDNSSGGVELRGERGRDDASVHRRIEYQGDRPEGASHRVEDGVLVLGGCGDDCSVTYTVELPAGLPVSGKASSGEVTLSRVGAVDVATDSGGIELDGVAGAVEARTSNGRIEGRGLRGGHVRAETSNGGIDLAPAKAQDVTAKTSNGAIELTVPAGAYEVSSRTSNGEKDIGIRDERGAPHRLDLVTSNGDITVGTS